MLPETTLPQPLALPRRPSVRTLSASPTTLMLALSFFFPVALFGCWVQRFAVNVPQWDDFSVLATLRYLKENDDPGILTRCLLGFHNEHRIVYTRLVAWAVSRVSGGPVDFRALMAVGNASMFALLSLLFVSFQRSRLPAFAWLPVPFLLVQMQYFENCFFAMAALQNLTVWLWAGLSLWLLHRRTGPSALLAGFFALVATGTSGNGLLVWAVGAGVLLAQRRHRCLLGWGAVTVAVAAAYLRGLASPPLGVGLSPGLVLKAFFGYLGAAAGAGAGPWLPVTAGTALATLAAWAGRRIWQREREALWTGEASFWLAFAGFVAASALAIALRRDLADVVSVSRYRVGSAVMLVLTYLLTVHALRPSHLPRWVLPFAVAGSVVFWGATYHRALPHVVATRTALLQDAADFEQTGRLANAAYRSRRYAPEHEWAEAVRWDLYRF